MWFIVISLVTHCVVGVLFHVEAVSLTCDNTSTDVCPGTELTCTCSVNSTDQKLTWKLSESEIITFDHDHSVGSNETRGIFVAVVTNNTGGVLESMLIYTANESLVLVNGIVCEEWEHNNKLSVSATIIGDIAG